MKTRALGLAALAAAVLLATGCSAPSQSSDTQESTASGSDALEVTSLSMGVIPVADAALAYIALDEGYFGEEGLEVTVEAMQNAAAIVPGVMNGQIQIGQAAVPPMVSAAGQGLPIAIVANAANAPAEAEADPSSILVAAGSGIASPKDLEGKVVAVNALQALIELNVRLAVERDGGDPSLVDFVPMSFADMAGALERGDIDAAGVFEPFRATGLEAGFTSISSPLVEAFDPGTTHAVFFSSKEFAAQAPNTIAAFDRAIQKAADAATADPALVRAILVKYGNLPEAVAEQINLPAYDGSQVSAASIDAFITAMVEQGFIENNAATAEDLLVK